ncbi:MAG: glycosyltransferase 87 family protein [Rhodoglobus sp.]
MMDDSPRSGVNQARVRHRHTLMVWSAFAVVHVWLGHLCLHAPGQGLNDVSIVYRMWVERAISSDSWVGIDTGWVYPIMAIVPMLLAASLGMANYSISWLWLMAIFNALAFGFLLGSRSQRRYALAWWWLAFLVLLGPIAVARIDSVTVSLGIIGVLVLAARPRLATVVLAVATWVKVWPAALVIAALLMVRRRAQFVLTGMAVSVAVVGVALLLGSGGRVFSFITEQTGRGLQIEAPVTTAWMWAAWAGTPGVSLYFDHEIITYQMRGPGVDVAAAVMTPLLGVVVLIIVLLGIRALRAGASGAQLAPSVALALVVALIAFNKVGSPQFVAWIAVPIIFGLTTAMEHGLSFRVPAVLGLIIAALTQLVYPYLYGYLALLHPLMLLVLTTRNVMVCVLLVWALVAITRAPGRRYSAELSPPLKEMSCS